MTLNTTRQDERYQKAFNFCNKVGLADPRTISKHSFWYPCRTLWLFRSIKSHDYGPFAHTPSTQSHQYIEHKCTSGPFWKICKCTKKKCLTQGFSVVRNIKFITFCKHIISLHKGLRNVNIAGFCSPKKWTLPASVHHTTPQQKSRYLYAVICWYPAHLDTSTEGTKKLCYF